MTDFSVTFAFLSPEIASSRLRAAIPQRELRKLGVDEGRDILVYGKHCVDMQTALLFKKRVYDICDDHFHTMHEAYYREHAQKADLITVNTDEMARIVLRETGRKAIIIPDPYESDEQPAGYCEGVLWFGHESNVKTIEPYRDVIDRVLTHPEWTRDIQLHAIKECALVCIPTDDRKGKSANRLIEAVRNGRFVVAGDLPAHDEFKDFMWIGDIQKGIEWAKRNKGECILRVRECQSYIRDKYSPERIGQLWLEALQSI
jgi:hypothetical protein